MQNRPYIIGLTGTMGSGKSESTKILKEKLGLPVIDADKIAYEICQKDAKGLEAIKEYFGEEYILEDGEYNRKLMSDTINKDHRALIKLNSILHPIIRERKEELLEELKDEPIVIYDCPLLFETGEDSFVDNILLITLDEDKRIERILKRDDLTKEDILKRISYQLPEKEKIKRSDVIILNDGTLEELELSLRQYIDYLS